jgi:hypothetical protein
VIEIVCPADRTLHYADASHVGRTIRCRSCGASLKIELQVEDPSLGREQGPEKKEWEPSVAREPSKDFEIDGPSPSKLIWRPEILIGGVLGVIVVMLFIAFWPSHASQTQTSSQYPAVPETPSALKSNAPVPPAVRRIQNAIPMRAKPALEENPLGMLPPCAQGREPARLKTGERLKPDAGTSGQSNIRVLNGGGLDAVVKLADSVTGKTARLAYIQAGHSLTFEGVETGAYLLQFQFGRDWTSECNQFLRDSDPAEFADPFVFLDDRIRFYTVTLSPAVGGKTRTRKIERNRFLQDD